ncbi:hypothetical protein PENTCL1PPCAC_2193 [Pristionchus entomophagus]|uniref:Partial AB-hydrolase lipase domain-containing protein n=1 Tax=Pristionchus entomophagus TaxID=358040 RepID=A0AAV5SCU3_9BILA|nr:hypothetical protein PENTCL1PPCAC_2193 [Pristionchus entomophagus]
MLLAVILLSIFSFSWGQKPGDDPEIFMTATEMIKYWGYPSEDHSAATEDGYILGMHRIPNGISGVNPSCRPVVFMQHGLESDTISWIANLPGQSAGSHFECSYFTIMYLGFVFADAGFDVWMGNARGNTYSKKHVNLTSEDEKFWEFSWDQMEQYDLGTMIDYVLEKTGEKSLYYIGHSQGTLTMFSKLSLDPSFAPKIKKFFALAPVGSVAHIQGSLHELVDRFGDEAELYYELFGSGEFLPNDMVTQLIAEWVCGTTEKGEDRCDNVLFQIMGPEMSDNFNKTRTEVYLSHNPAGTSTQNILHWLQMVEKGTVSRFDYGTTKLNYKHYG